MKDLSLKKRRKVSALRHPHQYIFVHILENNLNINFKNKIF